MKARYLLLSLLAATALPLALGGTTQASIISIGTSLNAGPITLQSSGATPGPVTFNGAVGAYNLDTVSGVDLTAASLDSNSINATATGTFAALHIFVSASDITSFNGLVQALSGLTVNFLSRGWTVTESTFEDNSNTVFGTTGPSVTLLATHMFTSGPDIFTKTTSVDVTSPFSVTEEFTVKSNGFAGAANNTIDLSGTVPETSTWAMLVLGFMGLGYTAFRRSAKTRRAATAI